MSLSGPEPLQPQHQLEDFDCGKPALNDWLHRHARQAQGSGSGKTFVVTDTGRVAGYVSLTVGQIDTLETPERIRKGIGQYPVPVVILARLAVAQQDQGRGIGVGLLQDAIRRTTLIAEHAGIRAMLTHPIDQYAAKFYARFGFVASPLREQQLLLLLKDARRWVGSAVTQINEPPIDLETAVDRPDHASKLAPQRPVSAIRGVCPGINTDVPNDAECKQAADDLITSKAAARIASVKRARKITLDDL